MRDLLYEAAIEYKKLEEIKYRIVVGRKGRSYNIVQHFPMESFFYLAGLQHLTDITLPSKNKERIYKDIFEFNLATYLVNGKEYVRVVLFLRDMILITQEELLKLQHYWWKK